MYKSIFSYKNMIKFILLQKQSYYYFFSGVKRIQTNKAVHT